MKRTSDFTEKSRDVTRLVYSGLAGFTAVAILQLVSCKSLDKFLTCSIYCFSVSLPLLILAIILLSKFTGLPFTVGSKIRIITKLLVKCSTLLTLLGVSTLFAHVLPIAGALFGVTTISAIIIYHLVSQQLLQSMGEKENKSGNP